MPQQRRSPKFKDFDFTRSKVKPQVRSLLGNFSDFCQLPEALGGEAVALRCQQTAARRWCGSSARHQGAREHAVEDGQRFGRACLRREVSFAKKAL